MVIFKIFNHIFGGDLTGIFSDWSIYTMKGDISLHDFVSDTGLIRGLGFYTHNEMTWDTDSTLTVSNFAAGNELTDVNTSALAHPYADSTAKPVHCIWHYYQSDYSKNFYSSITDRPQTVDYSCISGRDGEEYDSDFGSYSADNTDCSSFSKSNLSKDTMVSTRRSVLFSSVNSAVWLWTVLGVVIVLGLWTVCRSTSISKSKIQDVASSEYAPLITM